jgi:hypothetical protein
MAHEIEMIDGKAQMAYAGEKPWHGLGIEVPADLTPAQMLESAGLDWTVEKIPAYAEVAGKRVAVGKSALVRTSDNSVLDVVSDDWNPVQNSEAFEFFNDFIAQGDMEMHTAGSLKGGTIVWALAKVKDQFELFGGDRVESYLHFTNFHRYGCSTDVRFTPIRVVCNNTLTLSLNKRAEKMVKVSHRKVFDGDEVKVMMGVAHEKLMQYKEMASFLGSKRYTNENVIEFFKRVLPGSKKDEMSRLAKISYDTIETQPGAGFAQGSWWQAFNAVTHTIDHLAARTTDNRLTSAWYGFGKGAKTKALEAALEMAA